MTTQRTIPFAKVFIGESERKYLKEVLDSGWLTTAGKTLEFEQKFAAYVGAKYACAVNSCTAALHLGIDALGIQPGDKVFVPSMTFTASAEVIR
jgi:dTDP-4-amino-4,6-dideoxygalactose transaminase